MTNEEYRQITITDANGKEIARWSGPKENAWVLPFKITVEDMSREDSYDRAIGEALIAEAIFRPSHDGQEDEL